MSQQINQLLATILEQTSKPTPNRLVIAQAAENAQALLKKGIPKTAASPGQRLTVGDGFRFGCGFYMAATIAGFTLFFIIMTVATVLGTATIGALFNSIN